MSILRYVGSQLGRSHAGWCYSCRTTVYTAVRARFYSAMVEGRLRQILAFVVCCHIDFYSPVVKNRSCPYLTSYGSYPTVLAMIRQLPRCTCDASTSTSSTADHGIAFNSPTNPHIMRATLIRRAGYVLTPEPRIHDRAGPPDPRYNV